METLALWVGFGGAWVLFAGSIYQAALELQDEDIQMDRVRAAGAQVQKPPTIPIWWWLLPPIRFYLQKQRRRIFEHRVMTVLSHEDREALVSFHSKATAWLYVAIGGLCIACKETYELVHHLERGTVMLVAIIIGALVASIVNLVYRIRQAQQIIAHHKL